MTEIPPLPSIPPAPAVHLFAITPSDTMVFPTATRGLWIGGAGNVAIVALSDTGSPVTLTAVPAGTLLQIAAQQVMATGTTATDIVGMW